jgi:transposase
LQRYDYYNLIQAWNVDIQGERIVNILRIKRITGSKKLRRMYKKAESRRTAERMRAIYLLSIGKTPPQIADILGRHVKTVRAWIKLFNDEGPERLRYRHTGGQVSKISCEHEAKIGIWLKEGRPDGSKWTLKAISARIQVEYGIQISQQQISKRISRLGWGHLISKPRSLIRRRGSSEGCLEDGERLNDSRRKKPDGK